MDMYDASWQIAELLETNRSVFLKLEPEVPDFTTNSPFKVLVIGASSRVELDVTPKDLLGLIGLFDSTIFNSERVTSLYTYNLKALASYFHFVTKKYFTPTTSIIDLKVIENFLNIRKNSPENLVEAVNRTKLVIKNKNWLPVYKSIHLPLSLRVLPSIETTPLLNEESKGPVYPFYEIEGQINGRMNCFKKFAKTYLPHNMGPDVRSVLKPKGYGYIFLYSDFRHCEITVLQWLSGDLKLKQILDSGADLHEQIYEILTGDKCDTENKRNLSKKIFLPVMYGCGSGALAERIKIPDTVAKELISRTKHHFSTAWEWMYSRQEEAKRGIVTDYFGRPREFNEKEAYSARNFSTQGVAATVCQEKLIDLHKSIDGERVRIAFSVHDGYGLISAVDAAPEAYRQVKAVCESESRHCKGLRMKIEVKFGPKLDQMKVIPVPKKGNHR